MNDILYIVWNDSYNLGIAILDEQHRGIVTAINSLYYFIKNGDGQKAVQPILSFLDHYARIHFTTEERLLSQAKYPSFEEHVRLHRLLSIQLGSMSAKLGSNRDTDALLGFLRDWWLSHIMKEDRKYASHVLKLF